MTFTPPNFKEVGNIIDSRLAALKELKDVQETVTIESRGAQLPITDLNEFWSHHAPTEDEIDRRIEEWQFDYNWRRPHGSLGGKTPIDRIA